jgi:hypothetical protein
LIELVISKYRASTKQRPGLRREGHIRIHPFDTTTGTALRQGTAENSQANDPNALLF